MTSPGTQIWKSAKTPGSPHKKAMDIEEFTRAWKLCSGELKPKPRKPRGDSMKNSSSSSSSTNSGNAGTRNGSSSGGGARAGGGSDGKWAREGSVSMQAALARKAVAGVKARFEATAEANEDAAHATPPAVPLRRQKIAAAPTNNNAAMLASEKSASLNRRSRLSEAEDLGGAAAAAETPVGRLSSSSMDAAISLARVTQNTKYAFGDNYQSGDESNSNSDDDDDDYQTRSAALERKARLIEAEALAARRAANDHAAARTTDEKAGSGSGWARAGSVGLQAARQRGTLTIGGLQMFAESSTDDGYNGDNDYADTERAFQVQKDGDRRAAAAAAQARADVEAIEQAEAEAAVHRAAEEAEAAATAAASATACYAALA